MKKHLLKSLLALALVLISGNAWGAEQVWTYTFVSPNAVSDNSITVNGVTWSIGATVAEGTPSISAGNTYSKYGIKFGSSKSNYFNPVTFSTDAFSSYNVKSVKVVFLNNGAKDGTLTVKQGSTTIGTETKNFGQAWTELTASSSTGSGGALEIKYEVGQAFYINSITVTYETDDSKTNTSMSFGDDTEFEVLQGNTFSAPTVTLKAGETVLTGKTISYVSSAESVATVASDGTVTVAGMGKTTITASFAGDDNYNGSNASYDLTVVGVFTSFADASAAQGTSTEKNAVRMTFNNAKVTSLGTNVAYLTDGTEGKIYQKDHGFVAGNILNGTVRCTMTYNGGKIQFEGVTSTMDGLTVTNAPVINASKKNASFSYGVGSGPSTTESSNVSGSNLSADITATVTTGADYFEISLDGTTYSSSVVAPKNATTPLSIRMKAGLAKANYGGVVTLSSTDADDVTITLSGSVVSANFVWDLSTNSFASSSETLVTWDGTYATMKLEKGTSGTKANNFLGGTGTNTHTRVYQGHLITIMPASGYSINSIEFTSTSSDYAKKLKESSWSNATSSYSSSVVTASPKDGKSSVIVEIGEATRITEVKVYYEKITSLDVVISSAGWATAYLPYQAAVPTGVTAYIVTGTTGDALTLTEVTGNIPANTGVLLKGAEGKYTFASSSGTAADVTGNMLVGTADAAGKVFNAASTTYYILAYDPTDGLGFYYQVDDGASATCAQYKAVLAVPGSSSAIGFRLDGATRIGAVPAVAEDDVIYDLTGRRVENATRGIYIVNGKKVLVK